jgi:hypothetical protein
VLAALAIQERLREAEEGEDVSELRVRMGLNTGRTLVGSLGAGRSLDYTVVGDTANVAARLQQLAEPGAIVVSEATARLVAGYVRLEPLGSVQVRGRTEPVTAFQVTGVARRRSPSDPGDHPALTRFVGRSRHLASLRDLFDEACEGQGQVVGVVGEPGIGKTRLVTEFRRSLGHARATLLEGRCLSYASATPYLPLLDLLRANCAVVEGEPAEVTRMKVRVVLAEVGLRPDDHAPYLLHLLGVPGGTETLADLSPEAVKTRTFDTLLQMSLRGARRGPLVFVIEDLHWVDRTSEEFLASLADSLPAEPMMLLATYRPGYQPPWTGRSYATQLSLPRLAPGHCRELVRSLLPSQVADEAEVVVRRGEGNPFFLEELARVIQGGNGNGSTLVPDTIEGVLMARIDRLPDEPRRALQTASVLGREFATQLLRRVWDGADLDAQLVELKRLEFLHELGDRDEPRYAFKHALIQEVAYESLLSIRRRAVHAAAARALESLHRGRLEQVYDRLADHWYRAEEAEPAVEFLSRFAAQAAGAYAHVEASEALRKALALVGLLPEATRTRRRVELVLALARSLYFMGRFHESIALLSEHEHEASGLADPGLTGPYRFWLAHTQSHLGGTSRRCGTLGRPWPRPSEPPTPPLLARRTTCSAARDSGPGNSRSEPSTAGRRWSGSSAPESAGGSPSRTRGGASTSSSRATSGRPSPRPPGPGRSGERSATCGWRATPPSCAAGSGRHEVTGKRASATARRASSSRPILSADRSRAASWASRTGRRGTPPSPSSTSGAPSRSRTPSATAATPGCWRHGSARPTCRSGASRRRLAMRA